MHRILSNQKLRIAILSFWLDSLHPRKNVSELIKSGHTFGLLANFSDALCSRWLSNIYFFVINFHDFSPNLCDIFTAFSNFLCCFLQTPKSEKNSVLWSYWKMIKFQISNLWTKKSHHQGFYDYDRFLLMYDCVCDGEGGRQGSLNFLLPVTCTPVSHSFRCGSRLFVLFLLKNIMQYNAKNYPVSPSSRHLGNPAFRPLFSCLW